MLKSKLHIKFKPALLASSISLLLTGAAHSAETTFHQETFRTTPKLMLAPSATFLRETGENLARAYIDQNYAQFDIRSPKELRLVSSRESLLGTHYRYQQHIGGVAIDKAELIITISKDGSEVTKVFNNAYKTPANLLKAKAVKPTLSSQQAIETAWDMLKVRDKLTSAPTAELTYFVDNNGQFNLTHRVHIAAEGDTGGRMMYISANDGKLIHDYSTTLRRHGHLPSISALNERKGPVLSLQSELKRLRTGNIPMKRLSEVDEQTRAVATATAKVFDPDPRTTLANASLEDNDPASSFTNAYLTRTLQGVSLNGGVYSLSGEYVNITEIETPTTAPSTSTTGNWTATRGNNAFNDVTTYFHLDQSQRYIQSLGFKGSTGIIERPLRVDTDGVQGGDNSHYSYGGSSDYLAFGHGGVDDNEDADVILHEYGHAIHRNINSSWSGGDTGAMGEGFGDYWAGSYSYSTPNGQTFNPDDVMTWDGHSSSTWPGRVMNRTTAQYDFSHNYAAHRNHNGVNGDELWSTPLFQALKELMAAGRARSEMDKIILQAHFGLGSNLKMRDLANAIVTTAEQLYPSGPHAGVYRTHFERHGMIEGGGTNPTPDGELENGVAKTNLSGAKDSQTRFTMDVPAGASNLQFVTSGGSGDADLYVRFGAAPTSSTYDCRPWKGGNNETCTISNIQTGTYHVMLSGYSAYSGVSLTGSYDGGSSGGGGTKYFENTTDVAISDRQTSTSTINVSNSGSGGTITVGVDIKHTYIGDLRIDLIAPNGSSYRLKDTSNDSSDDILKNYSVNVGSTPYNGQWSLRVYDSYNGDTGKIDKWSITLP